jgi:hypothetical protein
MKDVGMNSSSSYKMPESTCAYPRGRRDAYREGKLFRHWVETYRGRMLFCDHMWDSGQIPHSGPVRDAFFFNELFLGTRYLDAGYEVLFYYRQVDDETCYQKLCELLGGTVNAQFVAPNSEAGGRAPDLLVFDPQNGRFRFVECKGRSETVTRRQLERFASIERYLANLGTCPPALADAHNTILFPRLSKDRWIHVARLDPV